MNQRIGMPKAKTTPKNFSFHNRADIGAFWEAWVGAVLARAGLFTIHYPFIVDGKDHSTTWDLEVLDGHPAYCTKPTTVEVKSRDVLFTCPEDYPFEAVNVCSLNSFQAKWPGSDKLGRDFLLVSQRTGAVLWLPEGSRIEVSEAWDGEQQRQFKIVQCPDTALRTLADFVEKVKDA